MSLTCVFSSEHFSSYPASSRIDVPSLCPRWGHPSTTMTSCPVGLPTFRFSGVADAQLRLNVREYAAVYGCLRALTDAVVAVTVAVGDTKDLPLLRRGVKLALYP